MATNSKKITNSTAKKPAAKKIVAVIPASKAPTKKAAATPVKKSITAATKKVAPMPAKRVSMPNTEKPVIKPATITKSAPQKSVKKNTVTPSERHHMISTAAYFQAHQRGFVCCCEKEDWLSGEAQIDALLNA